MRNKYRGTVDVKRVVEAVKKEPASYMRKIISICVPRPDSRNRRRR